MDEILNARIVLAQGEPIEVKNTFDMIVANAILEEENALAIVLEQEPEVILYCHYHALQEMYQGITKKDEFIEAWRCDGLYRNRVNLKTAQDDEVEAGSLWLHKGKRLLLMDDDRYIEAEINTVPQLFDKIA